MMTAMSGKFLPSPNPAELAENGPNRHQNITNPSIHFYSSQDVEDVQRRATKLLVSIRDLLYPEHLSKLKLPS